MELNGPYISKLLILLLVVGFRVFFYHVSSYMRSWTALLSLGTKEKRFCLISLVFSRYSAFQGIELHMK